MKCLINVNTQAKYIPLFPLGTLLLPGEQMPLHIFEPRYQQLFQEAEDNQVCFGLPFEDTSRNLKLVSMCKLLQVTNRYATGEMDVIIEAYEIATLTKQDQIFSGKLYPGGRLGASLESKGNVLASMETINLFADYITQKFGNRPTYASLHKYTLADVASSVTMDNNQKLKFIFVKSETERALYLNNVIKFLTFLLYQESKAEDGVLLN